MDLASWNQPRLGSIAPVPARIPALVRRAVVPALVATLALAGCAGDPVAGSADAGVAEQDGLQIAATTSILGELTEAVVGDAGEVTVLIAAGQDPHTTSLSARQVAGLHEADLVVTNGLGLEASLEDVLDQVAAEGVPVLEVGPALDPREVGDHGDHGHEQGGHDGHDHGPHDPHVWLDVDRMSRAPGVIADALDEVTPGPWAAAANELADELQALDREVESTIDTIPQECRRVATNHDVLGYFAQRYGLQVPVTVIPGTSTEADPSARDFAAGIETVRESGVSVVVVEDTTSPRLAEAFASDAGITVLRLPLAGPPAEGPGSGGYADMMRVVADGLAEALGSCP